MWSDGEAEAVRWRRRQRFQMVGRGIDERQGKSIDCPEVKWKLIQKVEAQVDGETGWTHSQMEGK